MDDTPGRFPPPPDSEPPVVQRAQPFGPFPMDAGRIFSLTLQLYRTHWRLFVGIALLILIPMALVQAASDLITGGASEEVLAQGRVIATGGTAVLSTLTLSLFGLSLLVSAVYGIASSIVEAGVTRAALGSQSGPAPTVRESTRFGLSRVVTLTAAYLVTTAASFGVLILGVTLAGFAGLAIPGGGQFLELVLIVAAVAALLFLVTRWSLVVPVVVVERLGALSSMGRSWRLVSGTGWRVFGFVIGFALLLLVLGLAIAFMLSLLVSVVLTATQSPIEPEQLDPIASFGSSVLVAFLAPIPAIGMLLLYLDLRFRAGEPVEPVPSAQK